MHTLTKLTPDLLVTSRNEWTAQLQAAEDRFSPYGYYHMLDSIELKLGNESKDDNIYYYALVNDQGRTAALLEVSHALPTLPNSWVKILSIRMMPALDTRMPVTDEDNSFTRFDSISVIASNIIATMLDETADRFSSQCLKIFTNAQADMKVWQGVIRELKASPTMSDLGVQFDSYGNWIEITF